MPPRRKKSTRSRTLNPEQTGRVVDALNRLIDLQGSQSAAAKVLDMSQGAVSQSLAGAPVGLMLASAVADALEMNVGELLGWDEEVATKDHYRNRARAVASARRIGVAESVIATVRALKPEGEDPPAEWWMRKILLV